MQDRSIRLGPPNMQDNGEPIQERLRRLLKTNFNAPMTGPTNEDLSKRSTSPAPASTTSSIAVPKGVVVLVAAGVGVLLLLRRR